MRISRRIACVLALVLSGTGASTGASADGLPKRVVSINACTDQLAMMLAGPGQLVSVTHLAQDPRVSSMTETAKAYPVNHGRAEEVFLLKPDLVLAGRYTQQPTVDMLRGLGIEVIQFDPARSLDDVTALLTQAGAALGRSDRATALIDAFDRQRATLLAALDTSAPRPSAALYFANGYTTGPGTLANDILETAGFSNVAQDAGFPGGGFMPLEVLVMADPAAVITGTRYPGASRAEEVMAHPVIAAVTDGAGKTMTTDADWLCGTPHVLRAAERLQPLRPAQTGDDGNDTR